MSDIEDMTISEARAAVQRGKEVEKLLSGPTSTSCKSEPRLDQSGFVGSYVVVRCRDAGVHAGVLKSLDGRSCVLSEARRLWAWKVPMGSSSFLNGVATDGLADGSQLGSPVEVLLTENCEIIKCTQKAEESIRGFATCNRTK